MKPRDLIELLVLAAIWGSSFLFMRVAAPEFGPVPLIFIRVGIAMVFLLAILSWQGGLASLRGKTGHFALVGAINSAIPFSLFAFATLSLTAGFTAVLNASVPLFGALVAYFWLADKLSLPRIVGLIVGFLGVLVLVWGKISFKDNGSGWAVVAALVASLSYGISANYTKRFLTGVSPLAIATGSQIAATILLLPLAALYWPDSMPSAKSWFSVLALGIACTGIAYILFFRLIAHVGPLKAVAVTYLLPVFGMLWGTLFLSESVTSNMILGCLVILLGVALAAGILKLPTRAKPIAPAVQS
ncbi:DMT family transporter [Permianibacter sp. IMCC34836]|uniref:DMT family transporter n=1 Tax=Permianibacter fluminis TaxID=2738515 RepID=UPI0015520051|nr:DMT family transporter [Permianibacter fluminis]NQD36721.1 DMT family transporter [Permianibacter fluminis]